MSFPSRLWRALPVGLLALAGVAVVAAVSRKLIRGGKGDLYIYYEAAKRLAAGGDLYGTPTPFHGLYYHYAPAFAFLNIPLTWLPVDVVVVLWTALSVLLSIWIFFAWQRALAGGPFSAEPLKVHWALALLTLMLILRPLLSHLNLAQSNIFLLALLVAACLLLFRARDFLGGAVLGFSFILKPFAAPFLLWQLAIGNWRALAGATAGGMAALLAPAGVVGLERNAFYLRDWLVHFGRTVAPGASEWTSSNIVSLHATLHRLFTPVVVHNLDESSTVLTVVELPAVAVQLIAGLLFAVLALWIVLVARRHRHDIIGVASFIFALTPVLSTTAQKHYFVLLLPACVYVAHAAVRRGLRDGPFLALVIVYFLATAVTGELLGNRALAQHLQALGVFPLGALALAAAVHRALFSLAQDDSKIAP